MLRSITRLAGAIAAAGTVAVLTAAAASASVQPNIVTIGSGEAGYYAVSGSAFANVGATITPRAAATDIGTIGQGGVGIQLCDPNNGEAVQAGLVANSNSTFSFEYADGTLSGANADNCVGNPLLSGPVALHATTLSSVAENDAVQALISFRDHRVAVWHKGHWTGCRSGKRWVRHCVWHPGYNTHPWRGEAKVQAFDATSGTEVYSTSWLPMAADWNMDNAGAGIQQDTTLVSANTPAAAFPGYDGTHGPTLSGASNDVADFSQVFVNGFGLGTPGFLTLGGSYTAFQVATAAGGNKANPALVAPNSSANSTVTSFSVYAGNPVG